jgi:hypothetical protein
MGVGTLNIVGLRPSYPHARMCRTRRRLCRFGSWGRIWKAAVEKCQGDGADNRGEWVMARRKSSATSSTALPGIAATFRLPVEVPTPYGKRVVRRRCAGRPTGSTGGC